MSLRNRVWTTAAGEERIVWQAGLIDAAGVRRQFNLKRDAIDWLAQARGQVKAGAFTPDSTSITFARAAALWLEHASAKGLERASILMMTQHVRHLDRLVGGERLARLTRPRVEQLADTLRRGHSPTMARMLLQSFKSVLIEARRRGLLAHDPAAGVRIDVGRRHVRKLEVGQDIPTVEEARAVLEAARDFYEQAFLALVINCGLRASELRGLAWGHVDLGKRPVVTVAVRADRFNDLGSPKSASSWRAIPLGESTAQALRKWRIAHAGVWHRRRPAGLRAEPEPAAVGPRLRARRGSALPAAQLPAFRDQPLAGGRAGPQAGAAAGRAQHPGDDHGSLRASHPAP
jgi:integrase